LEVFRAVNEKFGSFDIVFLPQFVQEDLGQSGRNRRRKPDVKQIIRFRIGSGGQPELLVAGSESLFR
jgi:hypothetical protein